MATDCTPSSLVKEASCLTGLSPQQLNSIVAYLLCQIAGNGSSTAPDSIDYPGPPALNPPLLQNVVVDSNGVVWTYYGSAWHQLPDNTGFNPTTRHEIINSGGAYDLGISGPYTYVNTHAGQVEIIITIEATVPTAATMVTLTIDSFSPFKIGPGTTAQTTEGFQTVSLILLHGETLVIAQDSGYPSSGYLITEMQELY